MHKQFNIEVYSVETNEVFPISGVSSSTKIGDLKVRLELIAGIPTHLQRIMYLDQGDMEDNSTFRHHDVVTGARLTLNIWKSWASLIRACARGHISDVMELGVTVDSNYRNPNIEQMLPEAKKECFLSRAAIALYVAVHRGHITLIQALLQTGVDIMATTKHGRNVLHVAAANGQDASIELLLQYCAGPLINSPDKLGETPLQTAATWGQKACEGRLFLFRWRKRAGSMKTTAPLTRDQLMAHQLFDSSSKTWLNGSQSQMYASNILPPQEFQGTGIESKKSHLSLVREKINKPTATRSTPTKVMPGHSSKRSRTTVSDGAVLTKGKVKGGIEEIFPISVQDIQASGYGQRENGNTSLNHQPAFSKTVKQYA